MGLGWSSIKSALRAWVKVTTGLPDDSVIIANDGGPQPKPPYAVINPRVAIARKGAFDAERETETPGVIERVGQRRVTVSINVYGPGAIAKAEAAQDGLETVAVSDIFAAAGLAVFDHGEVRDMTKFPATKAEERGQFDVRLNAASVSTEDVGWIEKMQAEGTVHTITDVELGFTVGPQEE